MERVLGRQTVIVAEGLDRILWQQLAELLGSLRDEAQGVDKMSEVLVHGVVLPRDREKLQGFE